jgi:hypothetical protein
MLNPFQWLPIAWKFVGKKRDGRNWFNFRPSFILGLIGVNHQTFQKKLGVNRQPLA